MLSGEGWTSLPYSYIALWTWLRSIMYLRWTWVSGSVSMSTMRNGLPYIISKGLNLVVILGATLTLERAIGSKRYHGSDVSWQSLLRVFFRVWLAYCTFPEDWGLQDEWRCCLIPRAWWELLVDPYYERRSIVTLEVKRQPKPSNNLLQKWLSHFCCPFCSGGEGLHLSGEKYL